MAGKSIYGNIFSKEIYRPIADVITKKIVNTTITPNQVTLGSFLAGCATAISFVINMPILGVILLQISILLDHIDGSLARMKQMQTKRGAFFDPVLDRLRDSIIFLGACLGKGEFILLLAYVNVVSILVSAYMFELSVAIFGEERKKEMEESVFVPLSNNTGLTPLILNSGYYARWVLLSIGVIWINFLMPIMIVITTYNFLVLVLFLVKHYFNKSFLC